MNIFSGKLKRIDLNAILTSSYFLWAVSITASILMWVYVTGMDEGAYITRKFTCPVEYRGLEAQAILRNRLSEVDVELRGSESAILGLDYSAVRAYVDARHLAAGKRYTVNILVDAPPGVGVVSVYPSQAVLDLVRQVTRLMTVEIVLPPDIPSGHYIDGAATIPNEVGIRGAEDDVAKVGAVRITPTLEDLQEGRELLMPVKFSQSEPFDATVAIEPAQVRFSGSLVRGLPRKRVPVNVKLSGTPHSDFQIRSIITDPSQVQVEADADTLPLIDAVDTETVDISGLDADRVIVVPLKAVNRNEMNSQNAQKDMTGDSVKMNVSGVKVSILLSEAEAERVITSIPVTFEGVNATNSTLPVLSGSSQLWFANPAAVNVTIAGRPSHIAALSADKTGAIRAYVDLSNIYMSPVSLPVKAEVLSADNLHVIRIEPQTVTVRKIN